MPDNVVKEKLQFTNLLKYKLSLRNFGSSTNDRLQISCRFLEDLELDNEKRLIFIPTAEKMKYSMTICISITLQI